MNFEACFKFLAERLKDEVIVTSAGNCSELWWEVTRETERVFYLEASMSLASLFAAGIALGAPERTVVAFSGDGAKFHQSNALYLEPVIRAIDMPFVAIERSDDIPRLATAYRHSRTLSRPVVVGFTREVLRGEA